MTTIDEEVEHMQLLHKIQLKIIGNTLTVSAIPNMRYNPASKLLLNKLLEKLSGTYPTETAAIASNTNIFDNLNKLGNNDITFHKAFNDFILNSNLDMATLFSLDFLRLLIDAF